MIFSRFNVTSVLFLGERAAKKKPATSIAPVVQTHS
jgi:hypothetical protein